MNALPTAVTPATPYTVAVCRHAVHHCDHCHQPGTTAIGALWRVSLHPARADLYFLHAHCLGFYKAAHGLRSVEGRIVR